MRGEVLYTYKMNRDEQGGGNISEIRSFEWTYFLNDPKVFAATKIYDMLIFNLIPILSQWPPLGIILNFYEATRIFLIQNESWEKSRER